MRIACCAPIASTIRAGLGGAGDEPAGDLTAAGPVFERNPDATAAKDRAAYLSRYLDSATLARSAAAAAPKA